MEQKFAAAWAAAREKAAALGIKMRPVAEADALKTAKRTLSGSRLSDGFTTLLAKGIDIRTVAALMGDDTKTVINTYVHYTDEMRAAAAAEIKKIFL